MVKSKFTPQEKTRIVLESINTRNSTAELCRKHNLHPPTFYQWREKFITGGKFSVTGTIKKSPEYVLQKEIETLKRIIRVDSLSIMSYSTPRIFDKNQPAPDPFTPSQFLFDTACFAQMLFLHMYKRNTATSFAPYMTL